MRKLFAIMFAAAVFAVTGCNVNDIGTPGGSGIQVSSGSSSVSSSASSASVSSSGSVSSVSSYSSSSSSSSSSGFVLPESTPTNCLILQSIDPAINSVVTSNTTMTATLEYNIASNETTTYQFSLLQIVEMTTPGFSVATSNVALADRHGLVTFTLPLGLIWSIPGIKHPIVMRFSLCNFSDASSSTEMFVISNIGYSE